MQVRAGIVSRGVFTKGFCADALEFDWEIATSRILQTEVQKSTRSLRCDRFSRAEIQIDIKESVRGKNVFIIQTGSG